jgi:hypothetical protein
MKSPQWRVAASLAATLVVGCAALAPPSFPPGASMPEVEARMGKPRNVVKAPDGDTVWQYPNGPIGQTTYIVRSAPTSARR